MNCKSAMKKFLSCVIAILLVIPMTFSVYAEEGVVNNNSETTEITEEQKENGAETLPESNDEPVVKEPTEGDKTVTDNHENDVTVNPEDEATGVNEDADDAEEPVVLGKKEIQNINDGWQFIDGGVAKDVNLPHCWEYTHPTMSYIPQMNKKTVTYTKTIDVSKLENKSVFLKFYAVNKTAKVYVNDKYVGEHIGGFSAFTFDISDYIHPEDGTAIIKVENTNIDTASIPINSDFTHFAGIYRDVELITVDKNAAYFSEEDYGSDALYVDYKLSSGSANVKIKTLLSLKEDKNTDYSIQYDILDGSGQSVAANKKDVTLKKALNQNITDSLTVSNPHLWNGTADPYLYTVKATLLDKDGTEIDSVSKRVGFRTFAVKNGKFYLNGKEYELHGVGMHQDREGYGNVTTDEMKREDINTITEMGANAIRVAHYPHSQILYDLADEKGLIVWAEIPFYMIMANTDLFKNSTKSQLIEMIRQNYNHPSIICWGIQNEVNTNAAYATYGPEFNVDNATLANFMKSLANTARKEDPSRLVVQAHIDGGSKLNESLAWTSSVDYTGFNLYRGFKSAIPAADQTGYDSIYKLYTDAINQYAATLNQDSIVISEYGAGGNIDQHATIDSDFSWSGNDNAEPEHPEEYMNFVHEAAYKAISDNDKVWASFVWNMFDFSSYRTPGGKARLNNKGLVTYDHKTRKDAYYFYKANWNKTDKFVYITSRRMTERTPKDSTIKVYSNCDKVKLYINGKDLGYGKKQQDGVFVWKNVTYDTEDLNTIKAVGEANGATYEDEVKNIKCVKEYVTYSTHVQNIGWQEIKNDGETAGTTGECKRLEAIKINLGMTDYEGGIEYRSHIQNIGWENTWKKDGEMSGTSGEAKRLEAIQIRLTGEMAEKYDVYYRVHAQNFGWMGWAKNGESAGTAGYAYRLEAIQIKLVPKGGRAPGSTKNAFRNPLVTYSTHVQNLGWQANVLDGVTSGTVGQAKRLEAIKLQLKNQEYAGDIEYKTHIQNLGWEKNWKKNGEISGTTGKAYRLEAIQIQLTGEMAKKYDVYYRTHAQNFGWMGWAKNGESAGTAGFAYRLEGIQIVLVPKGDPAPGNTANAFRQK